MNENPVIENPTSCLQYQVERGMEAIEKFGMADGKQPTPEDGPLVRFGDMAQYVEMLLAENKKLLSDLLFANKENDFLREHNTQRHVELSSENLQVIRDRLAAEKERDVLQGEVENLKEEVEALSHWRNLALQFDNHRMSALWHLKALLQSQEHLGAANDFLDMPPLAAHEIVAERDALRAENTRLRGAAPEEVMSAKGDKLFTFMSQDPCRYALCEVTYAHPVRQLMAERDALTVHLVEMTGSLKAVNAKLHEEFWNAYAGLNETRDMISATLASHGAEST